MKRFSWITDPHLDTIKGPRLIDFLLEIQEADTDGVFITGDISTGLWLEKHLLYLNKIIKKPKYFILGNHDFYDSSMDSIDKTVIQLTEQYNDLKYLDNEEVLQIADNVGLIGHNGWYGGDSVLTSIVFLWDWLFIKDFKKLKYNKKLDLNTRLATQAAHHVSRKLQTALKNFNTVYFLTHFPPWPELNYKFGDIADKFWLPYNSNKIMADELIRIMSLYPGKNLTVLAGHTHKKRIEQITSNIELRVGQAWHGRCEIAETIVLNG